MPRTKYDSVRDIGRIRANRNNGNGGYSPGTCVNCDKSMEKRSEKVVDTYDIHWTCYNANADPRENRLMSFINELEILLKKEQEENEAERKAYWEAYQAIIAEQKK